MEVGSLAILVRALREPSGGIVVAKGDRPRDWQGDLSEISVGGHTRVVGDGRVRPTVRVENIGIGQGSNVSFRGGYLAHLAGGIVGERGVEVRSSAHPALDESGVASGRVARPEARVVMVGDAGD